MYEWVARMWNVKPIGEAAALLESADDVLDSFLAEICETHLAQLRQNAIAWGKGHKRFEQEIQGCSYRKLPVSRYRVWCLEELRREWTALPDAAQDTLRALLGSKEAAILWEDGEFRGSDYDVDQQAPFNRAINVFENGVP